MPLITNSEMEYFEAVILGAGFEVDDFNVVDMKDEPKATVMVHRISTDEFITYRAGLGSIWPKEFAADLQAGKFGEL